MKKTKVEKGITLLALIITIVVLLILASVTIGAIKNSSIITHSQDTKKQYTEAEIEEKLQLAVLENYLANNGKINLAELKNKLKSDFGDNIEIEDGTIIITNGNNEYSYEISEDGIINKDTSTDSGDSQEIAMLKIIILGEDLAGKNLSEIMKEDSYSEFIDDKIKFIYKTTDRGDDDAVIYYIQYQGDYYKFRITGVDEEEYVVTDSKYGLQLVEKINENSMVGKKVEFNETMWTVLYDDETRGLQIISDKSFGNIALGEDNNIENTVKDYNDAINILNNACENLFKEGENYINNYIDDVRCVGSNPIKKEQTNTTPFTLEAISSWPISSYSIYGDDENYTSDFDRMVLLENLNSNKEYWLASKYIKQKWNLETGELRKFSYGLIYVHEDEIIEYGTLIMGDPETVECTKDEMALRPVVTLKSEIKFSGEGTTENPYKIINVENN